MLSRSISFSSQGELFQFLVAAAEGVNEVSGLVQALHGLAQVRDRHGHLAGVCHDRVGACQVCCGCVKVLLDIAALFGHGGVLSGSCSSPFGRRHGAARRHRHLTVRIPPLSEISVACSQDLPGARGYLRLAPTGVPHQVRGQPVPRGA
jgi:hypothetical protein